MFNFIRKYKMKKCMEMEIRKAKSLIEVSVFALKIYDELLEGTDNINLANDIGKIVEKANLTIDYNNMVIDDCNNLLNKL